MSPCRKPSMGLALAGKPQRCNPSLHVVYSLHFATSGQLKQVKAMYFKGPQGHARANMGARPQHKSSKKQECLKWKPQGQLNPCKTDPEFCLATGDSRAVSLTQNVERPGVTKPRVKPWIVNTVQGKPQDSKPSSGG